MKDSNPVVCIVGDVKPARAPFDSFRERILGSDHSSAFVVGHAAVGFQVLGVHCYSTPRTVLPLVELVKRTLGMTRELAQEVGADLSDREMLVHYLNILPEAWKLVSRSLRLGPDQHVLDGMGDRPNCGASDAVMLLERAHSGREGRTHVVVTYGSGLHLAICILREQHATGWNDVREPAQLAA